MNAGACITIAGGLLMLVGSAIVVWACWRPPSEWGTSRSCPWRLVDWIRVTATGERHPVVYDDPHPDGEPRWPELDPSRLSIEDLRP